MNTWPLVAINLLFIVISFQFDALSFFLSSDICKDSTVIRLLKNKHDDATTIDSAYYIIVCDTESVSVCILLYLYDSSLISNSLQHAVLEKNSNSKYCC